MSSSPPEGPFGAVLSASLEALAREAPAASGALARALQGLFVTLVVDGERVTVGAPDAHARVVPEVPGAVLARTSREAILGLIEGRDALPAAILEDRLALRGAVAQLSTAHDALMMYLHGVLRSPSQPAILARWRDGAPTVPR
ncbi:MAG: hypothetical protein HY909_18520 [Deltaproteobacteria bacterium]|nr:hypothetical protein [Deltaproteobacteria bacterium]